MGMILRKVRGVMAERGRGPSTWEVSRSLFGPDRLGLACAWAHKPCEFGSGSRPLPANAARV